MESAIATTQTTHQKFISFLREKKRASATILAYGKDIEQLLVFLEKNAKTNPTEVKQTDLEKFLESLNKGNYTQKSISRKINSIKTFYRFLKQGKMIAEDPAVFLVHPKYEITPPRILSKMEYRALRDACREDSRIASIVELLLQTGIRIGELAALTLEDIKETSIVIKPMEGHAGREIPLNKAAKNSLQKYLAIRSKTNESSVFVTKTGRPLLIRNIRTAIDRYFRIADIKNAKVNDLRHAFIAHHLMEGTSLVVVSKLAGHKRLSTTEKYLDLVKNKIEEKVKLGEL